MSKVIFFDVDGTLVGNDNIIPSSAIKAIKKARANGHKCFVCTGRSKVSTSDVLQHGFDGYICSAGGYIVVDEVLIDESHLSRADLEKAINCFKNNDVLYNLECNDATFMGEKMKEVFFLPMVTEKITLEEIYKREQQYFNFIDIEKYDGRPVQKMCFIAQSEEGLQAIKDELSDTYQVVVHPNFSFENYIAGEIIINSTNKAIGIQKVLEHLGKDVEDTVCFGDSMNDYQMLAYCHHSVVMGNRSEEVKPYASTICESIDEDGIYKELSRLDII